MSQEGSSLFRPSFRVAQASALVGWRSRFAFYCAVGSNSRLQIPRRTNSDTHCFVPASAGIGGTRSAGFCRTRVVRGTTCVLRYVLLRTFQPKALRATAARSHPVLWTGGVDSNRHHRPLRKRERPPCLVRRRTWVTSVSTSIACRVGAFLRKRSIRLPLCHRRHDPRSYLSAAIAEPVRQPTAAELPAERASEGSM